MKPRTLVGIRLPHNKHTAHLPPAIMPPPETVILPCSQHIGAPAEPVVQAGDTVAVGQLIARQNGRISSPLFAPVSGTVASVETRAVGSCPPAPVITIASDGRMTVSDSVRPPVVTDRDSFLAAVRDSGIVGMGGAGFPTYVKLSVPHPEELDEVIVNCAECEPYITSDTRTMLDRTDAIACGCRLLETYLSVKHIILALEDNKQEGIASLQALTEADPHISLKVLPSLYPQGGEKVLVYHLTGKTVPEGKLPADVGTLVINCTTLAEIADFVSTGMPLVSRCVTVDGTAAAHPQNVILPIGTKISDLIAFCGGTRVPPAKIVCGGPMMGLAVKSADQPILKNTNAVIVMDQKEATIRAESACIRCGRCLHHCPFSLNPKGIADAYERRDGEALTHLKVTLCMECGCCSYGCPASRPLVQINRLAKAFLRQSAQAQKKKESVPAAKADPKGGTVHG